MLLEIMQMTMMFGMIVMGILTLVLIAVGLYTLGSWAYHKLRGEL
jgi:predicted transporter